MGRARARVAVIGAGVSGMAATWFLQDDHDVTLFDESPRFGGHAETVPVECAGTTVQTELGPRFFFDSAYPHFLALLSVLGVPVRWIDARISITDVGGDSTWVLPPRSPRQVAALLRTPSFTRHLLSLRRLIANQSGAVARRDFSVTFRQYLADERYPASFGPEFAFPLLAACWGAPLHILPDFPAYSLLKGMPAGKRPGFYVIPGGMGGYMRTFGDALDRAELRLGLGVRRVDSRGGLHVEDRQGVRHPFDHVVVATSSRDAAALLDGAPALNRMHELLARFGHFDTDIVVHGDASLMPPNSRDWAHNNFFFDGSLAWMTDWQGLAEGAPVFRTWLPRGRPIPSPLYARRRYGHLVMTTETGMLQRRIAAEQGALGLWVAGMYAADVDNHESALLSAVVPALALAPKSKNLARLLTAVRAGAVHGLDVLPEPLRDQTSRPDLEASAPPPATRTEL